MLNKNLCALAWVAIGAAGLAAPAAPQQAPAVNGLLTGYASVWYSAAPEEDFRNDFTATISPMLLYALGEDLLFEGEMDVELHGDETDLHLEHAQIHYLGLERIQLTAGMFHVPFGIWHHASWVNRMPTPPLLYQDTHGAPPDGALLPILFDVGVMARANLPLVDGWNTSVTAWVSQGPSDGGGHHGTDDPDAPEPAVPGVGYGANFEDNNSDKMTGLQLRAVAPGGVTVQVSGFRAIYDHHGELGVYGGNLSVVWSAGTRQDPLFDFRGEGIVIGQEYEQADEVDKVSYGGYYLQLSRRLGGLEPVARWSQLPQSTAAGEVVLEARRQLALGLNYWIMPSVPLKVAYNIELDRANTLFLEWTVGF